MQHQKKPLLPQNRRLVLVFYGFFWFFLVFIGFIWFSKVGFLGFKSKNTKQKLTQIEHFFPTSETSFGLYI